MKYIVTLLCALLLSVTANAGTLTEAEAKVLTAKIDAMLGMFERGDPKALVAETHPSLVKLAGGKVQFEKSATQAMGEISKLGLKFISSENGAPSRTYKAGDEEICFVPRVSIMEFGGNRGKSTGFMVAIRKVGGTDWKFLDGAGLAKNPGLIYTLLPKLERGITLPPQSVEKL